MGKNCTVFGLFLRSLVGCLSKATAGERVCWEEKFYSPVPTHLCTSWLVEKDFAVSWPRGLNADIYGHVLKIVFGLRLPGMLCVFFSTLFLDWELDMN